MAIHDVDPTLLILRTAEELKKVDGIKAPEWAAFSKTGTNRERPPVQDDWWYIRSAAILRKLFIMGPIGTSKLRTKFGGRKNRGFKPEHFFPGAGNHIRKILQQLEKSGFAKQVDKDGHKGRIVTPAGHQILEKVSYEIMKEQNIVLPKKPDVKLEADKPKKSSKKPAAKKKVVRKRAPKKAKKEEVKESSE